MQCSDAQLGLRGTMPQAAHTQTQQLYSHATEPKAVQQRKIKVRYCLAAAASSVPSQWVTACCCSCQHESSMDACTAAGCTPNSSISAFVLIPCCDAWQTLSVVCPCPDCCSGGRMSCWQCSPPTSCLTGVSCVATRMPQESYLLSLHCSSVAKHSHQQQLMQECEYLQLLTPPCAWSEPQAVLPAMLRDERSIGNVWHFVHVLTCWRLLTLLHAGGEQLANGGW